MSAVCVARGCENFKTGGVTICRAHFRQYLYRSNQRMTFESWFEEQERQAREYVSVFFPLTHSQAS